MALVPETIMEDPDIAEWEKEPQRSFTSVSGMDEPKGFATINVSLDSFEQCHIAKAYFTKDTKFFKIAAKVDSKVHSKEFPGLTEEYIKLPKKIERNKNSFKMKLEKKKDFSIMQYLNKISLSATTIPVSPAKP